MTEPINPRKRAQKAAKAKFKKEIKGREMIPMDKPPKGTKTTVERPKPVWRSNKQAEKYKPITQAEKKQLMKENKCLKCKKIGHFARDCPQETNLWTLKQKLEEKERIDSIVNVLQRTQSKTELKQPRIMQHRGGIVEVKINGHPAMASGPANPRRGSYKCTILPNI